MKTASVFPSLSSAFLSLSFSFLGQLPLRSLMAEVTGSERWAHMSRSGKDTISFHVSLFSVRSTFLLSPLADYTLVAHWPESYYVSCLNQSLGRLQTNLGLVPSLKHTALGQTIDDRIALCREKNDEHGCYKCVKVSGVYFISELLKAMQVAFTYQKYLFSPHQTYPQSQNPRSLPRNLCFNKPSRGFVCTLKFQKHY